MNVGEFPSDHERLPRTGRNVLPEPQGASTGHGDDARALLHAGNGEDPPGQFLHNIQRRVLLQLGVRVGRCGPGAGPAPLRQDALVHLYLHLALLCSPALVGSTVEFLAGLSSNLFGQDFLGPTQSRVGSRETDGSEGKDYGMQDLRLRNSDAEQLAHMRTHAALRLCAHGDTELDQAAFPLTQRPGVVLGGAQSVEGFLYRREATPEVLVDLWQVVCHGLLLL